MTKTIIAIDGVAASGKGTVGRMIAKRYGYSYLDTGKLYRFLGMKAMLDYQLSEPNELNEIIEESRSELLVTSKKALSNLSHNSEEILADIELTTERVGVGASIISAVPEIREILLGFQRDFAKNSEKGAVLDGRDIGTVICPDAQYKFFITAELDVRAERRFKDLSQNDPNITYQQVYNDLKSRDERDKNRLSAPLIQAKDAFYLDTSVLSVNEAYLKLVEVIESSAA